MINSKVDVFKKRLKIIFYTLLFVFLISYLGKIFALNFINFRILAIGLAVFFFGLYMYYSKDWSLPNVLRGLSVMIIALLLGYLVIFTFIGFAFSGQLFGVFYEARWLWLFVIFLVILVIYLNHFIRNK